jgi:hypothetical protein
MVQVFKRDLLEPLTDLFRRHKELRNFREITVFGEFYGENSFAGFHQDEPHKIVPFDILVGHKQRKFLKPQEFIKTLDGVVEIPRVVYTGNLTDAFIESVRNGEYDVKEGVICKGTETSGAFMGCVWTCKIKTLKYFEKLKERFQEDWRKYGE